MPFLIVIGGPTATGKTSMAIQVARHYDTVILNCDSRQFYREMSIGTAKPTMAEQAQAKHYFIDTHSITEDYNAGKFETDALNLLDMLFKKHKVVILAGGSGLYIRAVCEGFDQLPESEPQIRQHLNNILRNEGLEKLQDKLKLADPVYFKTADIQNPQRVIRALEVIQITGKPYSELRNQKKSDRNFKIIKIALNKDREELYENIHTRVDQMIRQGLLDEARKLYPYGHLNALQTMGYTELFRSWDGEFDMEEAVRLIKRNSRRYAKRQITWFKKDPGFKWFRPDETDQIIAYIDNRIKKTNC